MNDTYSADRPRGALGVALGAALLVVVAHTGLGTLGLLLDAAPVQAIVGEWSAPYLDSDCPLRRAVATLQDTLKRG